MSNNSYYEKVGDKVTCIDDEIPFNIPQSWNWVRLENAMEINPTTPNVSDEALAGFIPMKNILDGYRNSFSFESKYWNDIKKGFTKFINNDIAFAKITPCFENRKSMILQDLPNSIGAGTTELHILRLNRSSIIATFVLWFVKTEYFIQYGCENFSGTAGQQRFGTAELKKILFPLPPIKEQKRIVLTINKIFEELDSYFI